MMESDINRCRDVGKILNVVFNVKREEEGRSVSRWKKGEEVLEGEKSIVVSAI